jgi:hypothetical protein
MQKLFGTIVFVALLAGCSTSTVDAERIAADHRYWAEKDVKYAAELEISDRKRKQRQLEAAERVKAEVETERLAAADSSITCNDRATCSKVFALAQIYTNLNSDQKIQVATDTIIETYNPTDAGKVGITIIKTPRHGSTEIISITPSCIEMETNGSTCRLKRTKIYAGFRPFIDGKLSK